MSKTSLLSVLLAFSLLLSACSKEETHQDAENANAVLSTNEFILTTLDKTQLAVTKTDSGFKLKNAENKVIIFDIFATWCPPCRAEASHLASLQKKYKDSLVVIGLSVKNNIANAKLEAFKKEYHADYTLVNSNENGRLIDALAKKLNVGSNFGIPLLAMYKDGKLINFYQGATEEEFIESDIKQALGL